MSKKVFIVIAAYNEENAIGKVIDNLKKNSYRNIVVVEDGGKDNTADVAEKHGAIVLRHVINRGQGAALKTGIDYALQEGADIIVTFDADGQHHADEIKNLLKPIVQEKTDVALGSRFLKKNKTLPAFRKFVLKTGVLFMRVLYGIKLTDAHNGFRALSRKAALAIDITADRMEHASEIVEEIHKKKLRYCEVPATITYSEYSLQKGQSAFNSVKIGVKLLLRKFLR
ncbi:glycosyltransferase family 2 protein [Candidatus Woesearchaeota archaeon]|nr:MAG: glycosyltransferase family 2 protein [Candidatus Woesearchaeota archaeon]